MIVDIVTHFESIRERSLSLLQLILGVTNLISRQASLIRNMFYYSVCY